MVRGSRVISASNTAQDDIFNQLNVLHISNIITYNMITFLNIVNLFFERLSFNISVLHSMKTMFLAEVNIRHYSIKFQG